MLSDHIDTVAVMTILAVKSDISEPCGFSFLDVTVLFVLAIFSLLPLFCQMSTSSAIATEICSFTECDFWLCNCILAAGISKYSGGTIHYFPGFHSISNPAEVEHFEATLRRYLTRKIGFEAVMRIRCTKGGQLILCEMFLYCY